jgi:two-component system chemotaxis response regulator CheB
MIVDDSAVVRGLVSRWIEEEPGLEVVARHANGRLAVEDVVRSAPDIVLLDIEMPVMDGLEALPLLLRERPELRVLMVSTLTKRNAEISFKALALGALDYVPKPARGKAQAPVEGVRASLPIASRARHDEA